jgi:hypothetical protein
MAAIGRYVIFFRLIDSTVRIERYTAPEIFHWCLAATKWRRLIKGAVN